MPHRLAPSRVEFAGQTDVSADNPRDENLYECLDLWLAPIPDGSTVGVSEDSDAFFRDRFQEFAFPRLHMVDPDHPVDVTLRMVPGPGQESCGNYSLERIEP